MYFDGITWFMVSTKICKVGKVKEVLVYDMLTGGWFMNICDVSP